MRRPWNLPELEQRRFTGRKGAGCISHMTSSEAWLSTLGTWGQLRLLLNVPPQLLRLLFKAVRKSCLALVLYKMFVHAPIHLMWGLG